MNFYGMKWIDYMYFYFKKKELNSSDFEKFKDLLIIRLVSGT